MRDGVLVGQLVISDYRNRFSATWLLYEMLAVGSGDINSAESEVRSEDTMWRVSG